MDNLLPECVEAVKHFEGCVLHTYVDVAGWRTIGYGHFEDQKAPDRTITQAEAESILAADLAIAESHALLLSPKLTGKRLGAIVDFIFNLGFANYANSGLRKAVNAEDWPTAARRIAQWNHVRIKGVLTESAWLTKRRAVEAEWLTNG
jgi:lysozyme